MKKIGIIAAVLLLLVTVQSTVYFLAMLKVKFITWLFFNACSPSSMVYLLGFFVYIVTKNKTLMYLGVLPMFFFGTFGLFLFPWSGTSIVAQIMHIIMLLNIAWLVILTFKESHFRQATVGLLLSIFIFGIFIGFQLYYSRSHAEDFKRFSMMRSR
jgi:hypothetical protein